MEILSLEEIEIIKTVFKKKMENLLSEIGYIFESISWYAKNCTDCKHKANINCEYLGEMCIEYALRISDSDCDFRKDKKEESEKLKASDCKESDIVVRKLTLHRYEIKCILIQDNFPTMAHVRLQSIHNHNDVRIEDIKTFEKNYRKKVK